MMAFIQEYGNLIDIILSLLLFVLGYFLGLRQSKIIKQLHYTQWALSQLEIREKIGCLKTRLHELEGKTKHPAYDKVADFLLTDAIAALPVLIITPITLQDEFARILNEVMLALKRSGYQDRLAELIRVTAEYASLIREEGKPKLAARIDGAIKQFLAIEEGGS
jgi:hypothetical protein